MFLQKFLRRVKCCAWRSGQLRISPVHSNAVINYASVILIRLFRKVLRDRLKNFWRNNKILFIYLLLTKFRKNPSIWPWTIFFLHFSHVFSYIQLGGTFFCFYLISEQSGFFSWVGLVGKVFFLQKLPSPPPLRIKCCAPKFTGSSQTLLQAYI